MKAKHLPALVLIAGILCGGWIAASSAAENKGAEKIELDGGSRGKVLFPHRRHQEKLVDCRSCHSVFPQQAGIIEAYKADGKLKPKTIMNKLCIKCHRERKKAGQPSGPRTCSKCHIKG
jgi:hypothetical protein